ncbi:MAG: DUF354 domain-containing protein [Zestosphaera sp.]
MREFKVWIDVLTSKQATLFGFLAKELVSRGHEVLSTCRDYEHTVGALERTGLKPVVVGRYVTGSPYDKVLGDADRIFGLTVHVERFRPDVLVAYPNPPAARLAFGAGVKYVAVTDSPHAYIPSRLSLPLADIVIASNCIPEDSVKRYMLRDARLIMYGGVDEVSWIIRSRPSEEYVRGLGLKPGRYVVVRPHEIHATYYRGVEVGFDLERFILEALDRGMKVVFLPRYPEHEDLVKRVSTAGRRGLIVIRDTYDGVSLTFYARAVISGGSTLAREAALLNTLGMTYYPSTLHVNECVKARGYPLFKISSAEDALELIEKPGVTSKDLEETLRRVRNDFEDLIKVGVQVIEEVK